MNTRNSAMEQMLALSARIEQEIAAGALGLEVLDRGRCVALEELEANDDASALDIRTRAID
jgi:hypothetical protein